MVSIPILLHWCMRSHKVMGWDLFSIPVSDITHHHSLHRESFADDTQLHQSAHITKTNLRIQDCMKDPQNQWWFITNYSSMMTKWNLCSPRHTQKVSQPPFSPSIYTDQSRWSFLFSMCLCRSRPNIIFQTACLDHLQSGIPGPPQNQYHLPLSFCWRNPNLICASVLSRIEYCNSILAGIPRYLLHRLPKTLNNAAYIVFK